MAKQERSDKPQRPQGQQGNRECQCASSVLVAPPDCSFTRSFICSHHERLCGSFPEREPIGCMHLYGERSCKGWVHMVKGLAS
jgi:hypothetical protein